MEKTQIKRSNYTMTEKYVMFANLEDNTPLFGLRVVMAFPALQYEKLLTKRSSLTADISKNIPFYMTQITNFTH